MTDAERLDLLERRQDRTDRLFVLVTRDHDGFVGVNDEAVAEYDRIVAELRAEQTHRVGPNLILNGTPS